MSKGIVILSCFLMPLPGMGQGQSQSFYDINTINTIELIFQETNWDQILDDLFAAGEEERLVGTAIINGVQFDSVGVRYKGNSTYRRNQKKSPLNIKLDHIIDDQELDGYGTLKLGNAFKDPTFVREVISYEIARKYMPASEANFASVYINGKWIGLYTSVQSVDKFFAEIHFGSRDNPFFKGELIHGSPRDPVIVWGYYGPDSASCSNFYELRSDAGWMDLIKFLDVLNNNPDMAEDVLNVDRHLWMLAFDNLMVNTMTGLNCITTRNIIDGVTFGPQRSDVSEGRYPNGTGDFIEMDPTFSSVNRSGITAVDDLPYQMEDQFILDQNVPNPFNPSTIIRYYIPHDGRVSLVITNVNGQQFTLEDAEKRTGYHEIEWNGSDLPSGVYFYRISVTSRDAKTHFTDVKKMILVK